jgi:adenylate kinase
VASGIALRGRIRDNPDSELSIKASGFMSRGELVPDEIIVPIIMEHLNSRECIENGFVLDGFPRTKAQAEILLSQIDLHLALYLDVPSKFLSYGVIEGNRRACEKCSAGYSNFDPPRSVGLCDKCGGNLVRRIDDNLEVIEKRLQQYDNQNESLLPFIKSKVAIEILPITVTNHEQVNEKHLKKFKGSIYMVETDDGDKKRMLNLEGMRERLYRLLADRFL